ncbi:hypothetical protein EXIGLDRAFT_721586 [Exidia glandulosa HHB12029]|uniref:Uncharacterized protein n=1 Tax=Exidia glandulosa HHB12029 TaxID=1314781 RepID=A0A166A798_EXIGL|nr:hypothetical protein EXIGLDRAFT_721586 [Exidia glandulosa HHB12029]
MDAPDNPVSTRGAVALPGSAPASFGTDCVGSSAEAALGAVTPTACSSFAAGADVAGLDSTACAPFSGTGFGAASGFAVALSDVGGFQHRLKYEPMVVVARREEILC